MATLLTGAGYIGAALLRRLSAERPTERLVVLENFFCTPRNAVQAALPPGAVLVEGDVGEPADVNRAFDALPESQPTVFHLAAQPSAAIAARDPSTTERSNLVGARVLLEAAREHAGRVVFASSFRVYGDDLIARTVDEETPYGRVGDLSHLSKIYVEQLARMLGVPFVSVRLGVTYGLSPIMKMDPPFMTVPNLFCKRAAHGDTLRVLEDRPMAFIHVDDAAGALLSAADVAKDWYVLNAAPEVATIGEVARTVQRLLQRRGRTAHIEGATASEASFQVRSRLDFQPQHTLATGLDAVLDYFLTAA